MNWQSLFDRVIMERGSGCFKDGAVVGLHRGTLEWQALVVGTKLYRVGVGMERGRVTSLRCNCPYAKEGKRCKHMAALFYALETRGQNVLRDDDSALSKMLDVLSSAEIEDLLQLAIDANSTRCTALLLNHKTAGAAPAFSLDEFTLDDLPANVLTGSIRDVQGDNEPMKLLFPEEEKAI